MPYQNPYFKTAQQIKVEYYTPLIIAYMSARPTTKQFTFAELKTGLGTDGDGLTKQVLFLVLLSMGIVSEEGA